MTNAEGKDAKEPARAESQLENTDMVETDSEDDMDDVDMLQRSEEEDKGVPPTDMPEEGLVEVEMLQRSTEGEAVEVKQAQPGDRVWTYLVGDGFTLKGVYKVLHEQNDECVEPILGLLHEVGRLPFLHCVDHHCNSMIASQCQLSPPVCRCKTITKWRSKYSWPRVGQGFLPPWVGARKSNLK